MDQVDPDISRRLLAFRESRKPRPWTQTQLAEWLTKRRGWTVTQSMVSDWENGRRLSKANSRFLNGALPKLPQATKQAS